MLALFTSYRMLKEVYERLKDELKAKGSDIEVLGQGMEGGTRNKLTRRFVAKSGFRAARYEQLLGRG